MRCALLRSPVMLAVLFAMAMLGLAGPSAALAVEEFNQALLNQNPTLPDINAGLKGIRRGTPSFDMALTYPAGMSPKVFTKGWLFGARGIANPGASAQADISGKIRWKGTGVFVPDAGPLSRPAFYAPGLNRITLSIEENGRVVFEKTFMVQAVAPQGYARAGSIAQCPNDAHGCPACPHAVSGPVTSGSPNVFIDGIPAARVGDSGRHGACCGPNTFVIKTGDPNVLIDGKPAARLGDQTQHCGGLGRIISAAGNR